MLHRRGRTRSYPIAVLLLLLLIASALVPQFFPKNSFLLSVLILANIWAILAMSWDILSGYAGQISFGHSFFFGLGGYTTAFLSVLYGWSPILVIALGGVVAALGGLLIAAPALRLRGPYLSLMTLVAALALDRLLRLLKPEIGIPGAEGAILCIPQCLLTYNTALKYYYSLGLMILIAGALYTLARSRIGLAFEAIRDDEEAAQAAGINTAKYKTLAFAISGFVAGVSGAFYVYHIGSASPSSLLDLEHSIEVIVAAVLGGMGTIIGPIFGAYFLVLVREYLRFLGGWRFFVLFAVALLVLFFVPRGVLPELRLKLRQWLQSGSGQRRNQKV
ncbi:MAG: hypothetical protein A2Z21_04030 [Candidatus Fraserbacteria bacterium RBG_16_55_9]|uniref:Branched-chain amino acid ABC transporter permease n=1 Tax=Fraserbacteria sp. (strain RBG_16_55_9) TaxID=1817864 RepID=A0A1F5V2P7_FRAXR|nr:MAG: hypothetical protein A2Z21_04030 [Candidatus Fraserbacteria bacterium RBG_16_55_9]